MTISVSRLSAETTTVNLNGATIDVHHQVAIERTKAAIERAKNKYAHRSGKAQYMIARWIDNSSEKIGATVLKLPEDYCGVSDETEDRNFEEVGTLLKNGHKWYVETDLNKVELLRRASEFYRMKNRKLSIGQFQYDFEAYGSHLAEIDKTKGQLYTRGHGLGF